MRLPMLVTFWVCRPPWMLADQQRRRTRYVGMGRPLAMPVIVCPTSHALLSPSCDSMLQNGRTASYWAARFGHLEALRTLLAAGANPAAANKVRAGIYGEIQPSLVRGLSFFVAKGTPFGGRQMSVWPPLPGGEGPCPDVLSSAVISADPILRHS